MVIFWWMGCVIESIPFSRNLYAQKRNVKYAGNLWKDYKRSKQCQKYGECFNEFGVDFALVKVRRIQSDVWITTQINDWCQSSESTIVGLQFSPYYWPLTFSMVILRRYSYSLCELLFATYLFLLKSFNAFLTI